MRDRPSFNEYFELELSRLGAASRFDDSETPGDASIPFSGNFISYGNEKLSECCGRFKSLVGL